MSIPLILTGEIYQANSDQPHTICIGQELNQADNLDI